MFKQNLLKSLSTGRRKYSFKIFLSPYLGKKGKRTDSCSIFQVLTACIPLPSLCVSGPSLVSVSTVSRPRPQVVSPLLGAGHMFPPPAPPPPATRDSWHLRPERRGAGSVQVSEVEAAGAGDQWSMGEIIHLWSKQGSLRMPLSQLRSLML